MVYNNYILTHIPTLFLNETYKRRFTAKFLRSIRNSGLHAAMTVFPKHKLHPP